MMKQQFLASLVGFAGSLGILLMLILMNNLSINNNKKLSISSVSFDVNQPKKKSTHVQKSAETIKKQKSIAPPSFESILAGSSFGLDQFEFLTDNGDGLLSNSSNIIMTESTVDTLPVASYRAALEYPSEARKNSIQGFVLLNVLIDSMGQVQDAKIIESKPEQIFNQTAINSIKEWQFEPASYQGKKVKIWIKQRISFNLN